MLTFIRTSGILIPREYENEQFYKNIKSHLTRTVRDFTGLNLTTLIFYTEGPKYLKIPRFFPIYNYLECIIQDQIIDGADIKIEHNISVRDDVQKNAIDFLLTHDSGIIQAEPGSGKTVMAIYMIATRKKKTIILMHRSTLIEQWKERILQYTNLTEDDIGILSSKSLENDLKKSIILATDQMITHMLANDRQRLLSELNNASIGIFIGDEVHTSVGGPTFAQCSLNISSKYVYGLSATPKRSDGQTDILYHHLGGVFIPGGKASTMDARVTILGFSYGIMNSKSRKYVMWNGDLNRARYLNLTIKSLPLEKVSKGLLLKFSKEGRNILYVGERIKLLENMYDWMPVEDKSKFIRSASNAELNSKAVFATMSKIRDGADANHLDCLIITSPCSNIEQLSGRILRIRPDKNQPIIIDMVDIDEGRISKTVWNRIKYYTKRKWETQYILLNEQGNYEVVSAETFKERI